ncbi:hypothetical protein FUSO4_03630 [Fusobacterium necrophorum DJ-1]|uniref:Uncharacterized protein n=3 Tax=Fusobacterium necrophorum TaxID=859 RepID=A0A0B4E564_9FUSO|nr:hypothetical protein FUSO3_11525 [Fusobacterium necrophorum BL]KDE66982.1 hypothetical protein FUSO4_03630 [Fusobacterium necrophorum DJ-1]KDE68021.1 hypothetical protein FUSO7_13600 [Fusobacterium necrophorum BFTR-2]KDE72547.1 hypothetical protein FUSO8_04890 [Fusobacterium necrophorum DJ-2]KID48658.1 hypothetical protein C095_09025 [Fusobacterium necrophorum subsp. funduliforme B35]
MTFILFGVRMILGYFKIEKRGGSINTYLCIYDTREE